MNNTIFPFIQKSYSHPPIGRDILEKYPCPDYNIEFNCCVLYENEETPKLKFIISRTWKKDEKAKYTQQFETIRITEFIPKDQIKIIITKEVIRMYLKAEIYQKLEKKDKLFNMWMEIIIKRVHIPDSVVFFLREYFDYKKDGIKTCTYCKKNNLFKTFYFSFNECVGCIECVNTKKMKPYT